MVAVNSRIGHGEGVCVSGILNISFLKFEATQYSVEKLWVLKGKFYFQENFWFCF